jgi:hypothetical protein
MRKNNSSSSKSVKKDDFFAQGTIEYLSIIGVIVVVSLVTVNLVVNVVGQSSGVSEESAKIAWKMASPFAITDWSMDDEGVLTLVLKNNSDKLIHFNYMNIGTDQNASAFSLPVGQTRTIRIATGDNYAVGSNFDYRKANILIDYNTLYIPNSRQYAPTDIVGKATN